MHARRFRQAVSMAVVLVGMFAFAAGAEKAVRSAISPLQFKSMLEHARDVPEPILLDIRTPKEFAQGHIDGAVLIDYYSRDFVNRLKTLDRQKTYLIYCRSGNRTGKSLAIFKKLGFLRVYHLETGIVGWVKANYPLVGPSGS